MPIYLLTNHKTHSRAVVYANNEQEARELRPDEAIWRNGRWVIPSATAFDLLPAKDLPEWPVGPEHVCADELARRPESRWTTAAAFVFAYEATTERREVGEGPSEWWDEEGNLR